MEFTAGGRLEVRINRADVGKRVSVRRRTGTAPGAGGFTDTVGVLTSWDAGVLSITRRDGESVRIEESALVAGKVVPAAPARRRGPAAGARELDRAAARAWPPVESARIGEWELRAAGGFTRRANSVLPLGGPGMPLDAALDQVRAWYRERGLPAYLQVSTGAADTQERLAAELASRGWTREAVTEVRVAALAPLADTTADLTRVTLSRDIGPAWLRRYRRSARPSPEVLQVLRGGPSVWFASVAGPDQGNGTDPHGTEEVEGTGGAAAPVAIGRCVVDGRWAGFAAVEVDPAHRRRGLATAVMAALARKALDEGASAAYLQVEADNDSARTFYDGMGFTTHHFHHHWRASQGGAH
ncbi:GNAT family N-acetyltransferase [Streptomyces sp. MST-110588]|uniref:GNAT family N-acetyltransferase n=1 Tax=Streptomyces sp. MST-110588 TaxID=2833628 RepID=UPI001F5D3618|nr:GNAT family N-acetyltransferase [Streptomyces sp. MST-110588]UNO40083.1 GNAT family N-acetyltransferase [Streptomyces sp. MST-110588]